MNTDQKITTVEEMVLRGLKYGVVMEEQPIPVSANIPQGQEDFAIRLVAEDGMALDPLEEMLVEHVQRFFTRNLIRDRVMPVVLEKNPCSLRDLFWLVTNYFLVRKTRFMVPDEEYPITLSDDYHAWMDHYGKDNFDTYQRGGRHFNVICDADPTFCFRETISQLIWFEWAIRRLVIEYAAMHIDNIRAHQKLTTFNNKQRRATEGKKFKRQPLTQRPERDMHMLPGQVSLRVRY